MDTAHRPSSASDRAAATLPLDTRLCANLTELVLCCTPAGAIRYANPAAQRHAASALEGQPFQCLLTPDTFGKGTAFLAAAAATPAPEITAPWELALGTTQRYAIASFQGYAEAGSLVLLGQVEPAQMTAMQQELLDLTSELTEAQRAQQRQNRQLQRALEEQRQLLHTIRDLSAPAVPIWPGVLLLPLVGQIDSERARLITAQLLDRVSASGARYVILDVSGIAVMDSAVAQHLLGTAAALRLLGARALLVGISPAIAQTMIQLGLRLDGLTVYSDLQHAVAAVLRQLGALA